MTTYSYMANIFTLTIRQEHVLCEVSMSTATTQEATPINETKKKIPFHETIAKMLLTAPIGITHDLHTAKAAEVMTLLGILEASKMPAAAAHQIAEDFKYLPKILSDVGQIRLTEFATLVLDDLKGREDEKKTE